MKDEAIKYALEVLRAIQDQFDEGSQQVYASALLFEDDCTLADHVNSAIICLNKAQN